MTHNYQDWKIILVRIGKRMYQP